MSVVIGADPAPETYADEKEHRAMLARHSRSVGDAVRSVDERVDAVSTDINDLIKIVWAGQITAAQNATFTLATATGVASGDLVFITPVTPAAGQLMAGSNGSSTDNGGYVVAAAAANTVALGHGTTASTSATFNVMVVRP